MVLEFNQHHVKGRRLPTGWHGSNHTRAQLITLWALQGKGNGADCSALMVSPIPTDSTGTGNKMAPVRTQHERRSHSTKQPSALTDTLPLGLFLRETYQHKVPDGMLLLCPNIPLFLVHASPPPTCVRGVIEGPCTSWANNLPFNCIFYSEIGSH